MEIAAVTKCSFSDVVYHAQILKNHSFLLHEARKAGYVMPEAKQPQHPDLSRAWVADTTLQSSGI